MNHVVFADPSNREARELGADALEQMAYQAESATWRNAFLLGARELREGVKPAPAGRRGGDVLRAMTDEMFFDDLAVRVNPQKADGLALRLNWIVEDADRCHVLELENCTLTATRARPDPAAGATVRMTRATLDAVLCRETDFPAAIAAGRVRVDGDAAVFDALLATLDGFRPTFNVVEP